MVAMVTVLAVLMISAPVTTELTVNPHGHSLIAQAELAQSKYTNYKIYLIIF